MKYCSISVIIILLIVSKYFDVNSVTFEQHERFEIKSIIKSNNYSSNESNYKSCTEWSLDESEITNIIKDSKPINGPEWHHLFGHYPCEISGEIIQNSKIFKYSINSGAWFRISTPDTTYLYGSFKKGNEKYFLEGVWDDEDSEKN